MMYMACSNCRTEAVLAGEKPKPLTKPKGLLEEALNGLPTRRSPRLFVEHVGRVQREPSTTFASALEQLEIRRPKATSLETPFADAVAKLGREDRQVA